MFNKALTTLCVAGVALTGLVAGGATAASAEERVGAERVQGPLVTKTSATRPYETSWAVEFGSLGSRRLTPETAVANAQVFELPAPGTQGPIITQDDLCLVKGPANPAHPYLNSVAAVRCTGGVEQDWVFGLDGSLRLQGLALSDGQASTEWSAGYIGNSSAVGSGNMDLVDLSLLAPVVSLAPLEATVESVNHKGKTAVLSGTGEPGAVVTAHGPSGSVETTVGADGRWALTAAGLNVGDNALRVVQLVDGKAAGEVDLTATVVKQLAEFTAQVDSVDQEAKSAAVSGKGEPGATITLTTPTGPVEFAVEASGTWSGVITGLAPGENAIAATQTVDGETSAEITLTIIIDELATPIVDPLMAGGVGLLIVALGAAAQARRKQTTLELA
ncbi:hypothetical protein ACFSWE_01655 [Leucobacter albus]|uniref:Bacterial Ig domain-containing protein n=1 Tax=Leucobacter albus TaxID=272210 RepID=A0ABW3TNJ7_9MICO